MKTILLINAQSRTLTWATFVSLNLNLDQFTGQNQYFLAFSELEKFSNTSIEASLRVAIGRKQPITE